MFINVCALYWNKDAVLKLEDINKRFKEPDLVKKLSNYLVVGKNNYISIPFLDDQLIDAGHISKTNSENGKKGGRPKVPKTLGNKPTAFSEKSEKKQRRRTF